MTGATVKLGATSLMYACQQGKGSQVHEIIKTKPGTILDRERSLKTALHYCAESGDGGVESAAALLRVAPELVAAQDQDGYTALHLAVIAGNVQLAKLLIAHGADVNTQDNEGHTCAHWATVCGEIDCLELILKKKGDPNIGDMHGGCPLHYAAQMCGPGSEMPADRRLGMAALRLLINHSANPNIPDNHGRQPILWAASAGSSEAILVLTNAGANVESSDKDGLTALHCAASRGHTDCVETLISLCNAEADVIDNNGCSALFYAVTLGHADCVQALLNHGANTNRQDRKGRTAMHCGAAKGQMETLKVVWNRGGNLWTRTARGDYPLHEAVTSGRCELVKWLLSLRPDAVNAPNNDGRCPLHLAAIHNNVEMCKVLLDAGSLVNPVMRTGKGLLATPLDAALHKGHRGTAKYLQLHGGVPAGRLNSESAALRGPNSRNSGISNQQPLDGEKDKIVEPLGSTKPSPLASQQNVKFPDQTQNILQVYVEDGVMIKRIRHAQSGEGEDRVRRRRRKRKTRNVHENKGFPRDRERYRKGYDGSTDEEGDTSPTSSIIETRQRTESDSEAVKGDHRLGWSGEKQNGKKEPLHERQESNGLKECIQEVEVELHRHHEVENVSGTESEHNDLLNQGNIGNDVVIKNNFKEGIGTDNGKSLQTDVAATEQIDPNVYLSSEPPKCTENNEENSSKNNSEDRTNNALEQPYDDGTVRNVIGESSPSEPPSINPSANEEGILDGTEKNISNIHEDLTPKEMEIKENEHNLDFAENGEELNNKIINENLEAIKENEKAQEVTDTENVKNEEILISSYEDGDDRTINTELKTENEISEIEGVRKSNEEDSIVEQQTNANYVIGEVQTNEEDVAEEEQTNEKATIEGDQNNGRDIVKEEQTSERMSESRKSFEDEGSDVMQNLNKTEGDHEMNEKEKLSSDLISVNEKDNLDSNMESGRMEGLSVQKGEDNIVSNSEQIENKFSILEEHSQKSVEHDEKLQMLEDKEGIEEPDSLDFIHGEDSSLPQEYESMSMGSVRHEYQRAEGNEVDNSNIKHSTISHTEEPEKGITKEGSISENEIDTKDLEEKPDKGEHLETVLTKNAMHEDSKKNKAKLSNKMKLKSTDTSIDDKQNEQDGKLISGKDKGLIKVLSNEKASFGLNRESRTRTKRKEWKQNRSTESWEPHPVSPQPDEENSQSGMRSPNEPSQFQDSGIEPSPHRVKKTKGLRPRSKSRIPRMCNKQQSDFDDDIPISTVSVTQAVQWSVRKYHLERRIFHQLLELKRLQIRAGRASESVLVKRLVDDYKRAGLMLGLQQYNGVYTFRAFERYLYDQLRILQSSERRMIPRLKSSDDLERLTSALKKTRAGKDILTSIPSNPALCTFQTHRCHHATHAYTGIPCAAYIRKNHHTMPKAGSFLPRLVNGDKTGELAKTLRFVDPSRPLTLELSHGSEKQVITLPTEKLDKSKRYFVTFTIKTGNQKKPEGNNGHVHASSV